MSSSARALRSSIRRGSCGCARTASRSGTCSPRASAKAASTRRSCARAWSSTTSAAFFEQHRQLRLICFNGNTAAGLFKRKVLPGLAPSWAAIERRALPSTSPGLCEPALRAEARALARGAWRSRDSHLNYAARHGSDQHGLDLSHSRLARGRGCERARVSRGALSALRRGRVAGRDRSRSRARERPPRRSRAAARRWRRARVPSRRRGASPTRPSRSRSHSRTSTCSSSSSPPICRCCRRDRSRPVRCSSSCARATRHAARPRPRTGSAAARRVLSRSASGRGALVVEPPVARVLARQDLPRLGRPARGCRARSRRVSRSRA